MEMIFCPNCNKLTGYKRVIGFATFFAVVLTAGLWLFTIPFYPKRCITCGLRKSDSVPWYSGWKPAVLIALGLIVITVAITNPGDRIAKHNYAETPTSSVTPVENAVAPRPSPLPNTLSDGDSTQPASAFAPDVIDPTHSTEWVVGGLAATFEPAQRMRAEVSGPVAIRGATGEWTFPVLVYSDSTENIYVEADAVEVEPFPVYAAGPKLGDLGWGNLLSYLREQSFVGYFVTEFNDPEITRSLISSLQAAHPEQLHESIHPELLKYRVEELAFDLRGRTMKIASLGVYDIDGQFLAAPKFERDYEVRLTDDSRWSEVAHNVATRLEQAKDNPKVADGIERIMESFAPKAPTQTTSESSTPRMSLGAPTEPTQQAIINRKSPPIPGFNKYRSEKFGFTLEYPQFFVAQSSQTDDEVTFTSSDGSAQLIVAGHNNPGLVMGDYLRRAAQGGTVLYEEAGKDWFTVVWRDGEKRGYLKMFVGPGSINSFATTFPESWRPEYDAALERMERSFKPGDTSRAR